MKISIALCTYNGARYLAEQLESIAAQDRLPDELVVRDDSSTDATAAIVAEFSRRVSFPVLLTVNQTRLGVTGNFEQAIASCSGDIIFLCDQDDYWLPAKLRLLAAEFEADDDVGLAFSDAVVTDSRLGPLGHKVWESFGFDNEARRRVNAGEALNQFVRRYAVTGATAAFRASLRPKIFPIPAVYLHDAWIAFIAAACSRVVAIDSALILYRQHDANVAGGKKKSLFEKVRASRGTPPLEFDLEIVRSRELLRKLTSLTDCRVDRQHLSFIESKIRHLTARREIFDCGFWKRMAIAARELGSRRYFEFSSGASSAVTDLLRPS